jgi:DNA-binding LacI/PurR family transcriptional regulator
VAPQRRERRRRLTIADVAHAAQVSTGAVSYALNGRPGVTEQTRMRILAAAKELGWQPSASARALVNSRSYAVGLVMSRPPDLLESDPFFPRFLAGVEKALYETDYALLLQVVGTNDAREVECYKRLAAAHRIDGAFLTDLRRNDHRFQLVEQLALPVVGVGQPDGGSECPWIAPDDVDAMEQVVHHLSELHHEHIAFVGGPPAYVHSHHRQKGWREALKQAGLSPGPVAVGDFTGPGGASATGQVLSSKRRPTAIVYANDLMAIAGMTVARQLGIRIPEQLSITGFDDIPLATHVEPALTTVREDVTTWGRLAADLLLAVIEERPAAVPQLGRPQLIVRDSTAPPGP